ncbi:MAG: rRNA pseudouridine synthase [Lachnospiraceae bacterium]|nr:rRNA pseudouridine synthase [Lachnospiraceae bacterium]
MRLDKYLADAGCGTRSELKKSIRRGMAAVDGNVIRDVGFHVPEDASVTFQGRPVKAEKQVYYMLHKPAGVITAVTDRTERTVMDLMGGAPGKGLYPVGRLDRDTEGLLLITNDGKLGHYLLAPGHHVDKIYFARVSGTVTDEDVRAFREGLVLGDGVRCLSADLKILSVSGPGADDGTPEGDGSPENSTTPPGTSEVEITICEGKYHQIKRMFRAVGKEVVYLKRLAMGPLRLDEALPAGSWRALTEAELNELRASVPVYS